MFVRGSAYLAAYHDDSFARLSAIRSTDISCSPVCTRSRFAVSWTGILRAVPRRVGDRQSLSRPDAAINVVSRPVARLSGAPAFGQLIYTGKLQSEANAKPDAVERIFSHDVRMIEMRDNWICAQAEQAGGDWGKGTKLGRAIHCLSFEVKIYPVHSQNCLYIVPHFDNKDNP